MMEPLRPLCVRMFTNACVAVAPDTLVTKALHIDHKLNTLTGRSTHGKFAVPLHKNVYVAAFGKAALGMCRAAEQSLGSHLVRGIASVPYNSADTLIKNNLSHLLPQPNSLIEVHEGARDNLPDTAAANTACLIEGMAVQLGAGDVLLTLVSGGGSALLPAPVPAISLQDKLACIRGVAGAGANITQLNCVRQNLSRLKNGGLARAAYPATVISLLISDIVENELHFVASGPTVPPNTTAVDALKVIKASNYTAPESVLKYLNEQQQRTIDRTHDYSNVHNILVGDNRVALSSAEDTALKGGHSYAKIVRSDLTGEASNVGKAMAHSLAAAFNKGVPLDRNVDYMSTTQRQAESVPFTHIYGGETTVELKGRGKGGRNQEMVLSFVLQAIQLGLHSSPHSYVFLSAGTDGQDGPTDVAGVAVDGNDVKLIADNPKMIALAREALDTNDSYTFWHQFRQGACFIQPGLTGTNVMDMQVLSAM